MQKKKCHACTDFSCLDACKETIYRTNPGTRKVNRLEENMESADIKLTQDEVKSIDEMLDHMPMSQVFGGSKIQKK